MEYVCVYMYVKERSDKIFVAKTRYHIYRNRIMSLNRMKN